MAASWPSGAASFGGPRTTFVANHPVQAAWMEIVPRLHELCKLVENMAAAPCADQYFDIFNRHTALLAKIEELEPSPDPMSVPHSFSIPNPPARTVLPDLVTSIYDSTVTLDESFNFGAALQQIAPLHLHVPSQPSHQQQAPAAPQMQHASVSAAHQVQQQLFVQSVSHHGAPASAPHHGQYSSKSAPRTTTPAANPGFYMYQPPQAHSPAPVFQHSAAPQMQSSPISQLPTTGVRPPPYADEPAFHKSEARRDSTAGMMAPPAAPGAAGPVRTKRTKPPQSASSKRQQQAQHLRKESPSSESIGTPDEESDSEDRDKKKRKNRPKEKRASTHPNQSCRQCGATETPEWRRGPDGSHTLCNACGLRFSKQLRKKGEEEVAAAMEAAAQAPQGNADGLGAAHPLHSQSNSSVYSFSNEHVLEPPPDEVPLATELPPAATNA